MLKCEECENQFQFSVRDQKYYASNNYVYPGRCTACRPKRNVCYNFQKGTCYRGSACRFLHEDSFNNDWYGSKIDYSSDVVGPVCFEYKKGRCKKGSLCRYVHDWRPVSVWSTTNNVDSFVASVPLNLWPGGESVSPCWYSNSHEDAQIKGWTGGEGNWSVS
jgi:hypothetical protein